MLGKQIPTIFPRTPWRLPFEDSLAAPDHPQWRFVQFIVACFSEINFVVQLAEDQVHNAPAARALE